MRRTLWTLGVAVLAFAVSPVLAQDKPGPGTKSGEGFDFKAHLRKQLDAWQTLDPAKAAPFYSQDADAVFYDVAPLVYHGWKEYAEGVKPIFAGFSSLKIAERDVRTVQRGNIAITTYLTKMEAVEKSGAKQNMDGRCTTLWQKSGKTWLVEHEHCSVPIEMPGAPAAKK